MADKNGVRIRFETEMQNENVCFCVEPEMDYAQRVFVENSGTSSIYFNYYSPLHWIHCFKFEDEEKVTRNNPLEISPGERKKAL